MFEPFLMGLQLVDDPAIVYRKDSLLSFYINSISSRCQGPQKCNRSHNIVFFFGSRDHVLQSELAKCYLDFVYFSLGLSFVGKFVFLFIYSVKVNIQKLNALLILLKTVYYFCIMLFKTCNMSFIISLSLSLLDVQQACLAGLLIYTQASQRHRNRDR